MKADVSTANAAEPEVDQQMLAMVRVVTENAIVELRRYAQTALAEVQQAAKTSLDEHRLLIEQERHFIRGISPEGGVVRRLSSSSVTPRSTLQVSESGMLAASDQASAARVEFREKVSEGQTANDNDSIQSDINTTGMMSGARTPMTPDPSTVRPSAQDARDNWMPTAPTKAFGATDSMLRAFAMGLGPMQRLCQHIVGATYFNYAMSAVIMCNSVLIGYEIDVELRNQDAVWLGWTEHAFLAIYVFELLLHAVAFGSHFLDSNWIRFDLLLVVIGVTSSWIIVPVLTYVDLGSGQGKVLETMKQLIIFRIARLMRLGRAIRLMESFEILGKLVQGLLSSVSTMVSAFLLIFLIISVLACIAAELITKSDLRTHPVTGPLIATRMQDIPNIVLSLLQFTTADNISTLYVPLVQARPWLAVYWLFTLLVVSILLMNLVTAIVVEDSITRASQDVEMQNARVKRKLKRYKPIIESVFEELDVSGDDCLQISEVIEGLKNMHALRTKIPEDLKCALSDKLVDLFEYIDIDGSGTLSKAEFIDGVVHLALTNVPVETIQIIQLLRFQRSRTGRTEQALSAILHDLNIEFDFAKPSSDADEELSQASLGITSGRVISMGGEGRGFLLEEGVAVDSCDSCPIALITSAQVPTSTAERETVCVENKAMFGPGADCQAFSTPFTDAALAEGSTFADRPSVVNYDMNSGRLPRGLRPVDEIHKEYEFDI